MRARTAALLALLAAFSLAAALLFAGDRGGSTLAGDQPVFPGLAGRLADAQRVQITHQGQTLTLARDGDTWRLPDHASYPVEPAVLHALLAGLAGLREVEPRTADPEAYARLGLEDPDGAGAPGTLVRVLGSDGAAIAAVVLGATRIGGQGEATRRDLYLRRPDAPQTWLAQPLVVASPDWLDWVGRTIVDIRADELAGIVSTRAGGPRLELARDGERLSLVAPPQHPALDRFKLDDMGRALADLTLHDVAAAGDAPGMVVGEATLTTRQGLALTVSVRRAGAAVWLALDARGDGAAAEAAASLHQRLSGWAFQVDPWKEAALVPTLSDLAAYVAPARPLRR